MFGILMLLNMCCPHYLKENENWNQIIGWIKIEANIQFKKINIFTIRLMILPQCFFLLKFSGTIYICNIGM